MVWLRLKHPNILPLLGTIRDPGFHPDIPAMVCPWVQNGALSTYLEQNNNLTVTKKVALVGSRWNLQCQVAYILFSRSMTWHVAYNTVRRRPLYCLVPLTICLTVHSQHIVHGDLSGVRILVVIPGSFLIHQIE